MLSVELEIHSKLIADKTITNVIHILNRQTDNV